MTDSLKHQNLSIGATSVDIFTLGVLEELGMAYILIQNTHATQDLYLNLTGAAGASGDAVVGEGVKVAAGSSYEMTREKQNIPGGRIAGIGSGAATTVLVTSDK